MLWLRMTSRWAVGPRLLLLTTRPASVRLQSQQATAGDPGDLAAAAAAPPLPRDYALPNASWTERTLALYQKYLARTPEGGGGASGWVRLKSFNRTILHEPEYRARARGPRQQRLMTRNMDVEGAAFEHAMFHNRAERRTVCVFQAGPLLEGFPGLVHGGALAALIDGTAGTCAHHTAGMVMTANLNIDYRSPVALGSTVLLDAHVTAVDGKKVFTTCRVVSHDESTVHSDSSALFIVVDEEKVRHIKKKFLQSERQHA